MTDQNMIIDEEYCRSMGRWFRIQGERMEHLYRDYIKLLDVACSSALLGGEVSTELKIYMNCAENLLGLLNEFSETIENQISMFLANVSIADQYVF